MSDIDVPCGPEDLGDLVSEEKLSEVLREKKKLENIDSCKFDFNTRAKLYINEILCPYDRGLWRKYKRFWLNKAVFSFYTINNILHTGKSERDNVIIITHDEDLLQFHEKKNHIFCKQIFNCHTLCYRYQSVYFC